MWRGPSGEKEVVPEHGSREAQESLDSRLESRTGEAGGGAKRGFD